MPVTLQPTTLKYKNGNTFVAADCLKGDQGSPGDPTQLIDDTAGSGDTGKVWSADKTSSEVGGVKDRVGALEPAASATDIGKALIVKTVSDGKATSYEFGTAGGGGGHDIPTGGTQGQILTKHSATDYDVEWATPADPTSVIDDNAGPFSTDKTFSASKLWGDLGGKVDKTGAQFNDISMGRVPNSTVGTQSIAIGTSDNPNQGAIASGDNSVAVGTYVQATGNRAIAIGGTTQATGLNATAIGGSVTASGDFSFSHGSSTSAQGINSTAEGYGTTASGNSAHAEGNQTFAVGDYSHSQGYGTRANGNASSAEGNGTVANGANSSVSGMYNVPDSYANWPDWAPNTYYAAGDKVHFQDEESGDPRGEYFVCNTSHTSGTAWITYSFYWDSDNGKMNYAQIVGNGSNYLQQSNAYTLDWDGNGSYAGDVTINKGTAEEVSVSELKTEINSCNNDIEYIEGQNVLDMATRTAGVIFTGDQSSNYTANINATTLAMQDSSVTNAVKANVTGSTNIRIEKGYSSRFVIGTFSSEPSTGSIGLRRIDNAASVTSYDMTLTSEEKWLLIVYFHNSEDSSRNLTTIKNSIKITSLDEAEKYSKRLEIIERNASESHSALGLDAPVNLFDPTGDSANVLMTINQGALIYVTSSKVHGMYCEVPSGTVVSVSKPVSSRFVVGTSASEPTNGGTVTQVFDVNTSYTKHTLTTGTNDKYLFVAYFHDDDDASRDIDVICAGIKVFVGTEWRDGVSNFLHPLSAMPSYLTKLLSYRPLGQLAKPYICLSCDDGDATLATDTIPALKAYKTTYSQNIPVTFGLLNTSTVVTNATYRELVQEMVSDYGCSVAVHGDVTFTNLDEIALQAELKTQKDALTTAGFTPNGIIYPQHSFNEMVCAVAGGQYGVCCTGGNYTDLTYGDGNACGPRSNMFALYRLSLFNSSMTTQKIHDYVDYIEANNMLMCAFWHDSSFASNHALLDELVSYAVGKGIDFITIGDILTIV